MTCLCKLKNQYLDYFLYANSSTLLWYTFLIPDEFSEILSNLKVYGSILPETLKLISLLKNDVLVLNLTGANLKESAKKVIATREGEVIKYFYFSCTADCIIFIDNFHF